MDAERLAAARTQFEDDGFYLHQEPLVPDDLIRRATEGMDAVRSGDYDTGEPPRGGWQPGDDPQKLCKIEMPQIANRAILELVSHPAIGELAAAISGASLSLTTCTAGWSPASEGSETSCAIRHSTP